MQTVMPSIGTDDGKFHPGNQLTGQRGTVVTADFLNDIQAAMQSTQDEIISVLTAAGINPDSASTSQLLSAMKLVCRSLFDTAIPVGVPIPYPSATLPSATEGMVYLKMNGASFNKTAYPKLALVYTSGILPDLRGEFIRGWDDGRGADTSRLMLSTQGDAIRNITGVQSLVVAFNGESTGAFYNKGKNANEGVYSDGSAITDGPPVGDTTIGKSQGEKIYFDASLVVPTANENRPRNVVFNYIVRAS